MRVPSYLTALHRLRRRDGGVLHPVSVCDGSGESVSLYSLCGLPLAVPDTTHQLTMRCPGSGPCNDASTPSSQAPEPCAPPGLTLVSSAILARVWRLSGQIECANVS